MLILDEVGFVPFSKAGAELLFGLHTDRYERGSVLVTSSLDFASWSEVFGDPRLTAALLDRLTHRCHIIEFQGDSFRFKENLRRRGSPNSSSQHQKVGDFSSITVGGFWVDNYIVVGF